MSCSSERQKQQPNNPTGKLWSHARGSWYPWGVSRKITSAGHSTRHCSQFLARAKAWLENAEAENNLILGNSMSLEAAPQRWTIQPYLLTVEDEKNLLSAALMTPPHHLVVSRSPKRGLTAFADWLLGEQVDISGVLGPKLEAKTFADYWVNKTDKLLQAGLPQQIYACSLKKGYATSCVTALTRRMLHSGKNFCCLYTDLTNPTSNSIYQKIGYQPICDVQDWIFE